MRDYQCPMAPEGKLAGEGTSRKKGVRIRQDNRQWPRPIARVLNLKPNTNDFIPGDRVRCATDPDKADPVGRTFDVDWIVRVTAEIGVSHG
jgi:hypothetical protein